MPVNMLLLLRLRAWNFPSMSGVPYLGRGRDIGLPAGQKFWQAPSGVAAEELCQGRYVSAVSGAVPHPAG